MDQDPETLQHKLTITETAVKLYEQPKESVTFHQIVADTALTVSEIFNLFNNKQEIFRFYYNSLIIRYRLMIDEIDGFEEYTLSEKLSNFAFTSFDMMSEHKVFVEDTFKSQILCSYKNKRYRKQLQELLKDFFEHDDLPSASGSYLMNKFALNILVRKYLLLVLFWLNDESEDKEATMELTDKLTGLLQEIMYTSVVDRSIDLAKFLYSNRSFYCDYSLFNKMRSTFEIQ